MALWLLSPLHKAARQITVYLEAGMTELSSAEGHLLSYVAPYGPCPITELVRVFGLSASTLTGMLDRLERAGLLARTVNARDRRSYLIAATPAGQLKAAEIREKLERLEADVAARLTEQDMAGFAAVMAAVGEVTQVILRGGEAPSPVGAQQEGGA
jgi:DNA-binding MarR family transcriptional regulator